MESRVSIIEAVDFCFQDNGQKTDSYKSIYSVGLVSCSCQFTSASCAPVVHLLSASAFHMSEDEGLGVNNSFQPQIVQLNRISFYL